VEYFLMLQKAVICDLDGTLCNAEHRLQYVNGTQKKDWKAFNELSAHDEPYEWCLDLVHGMSARGYEIVFLTAREGSKATESVTREWLDRHIHFHYILLMRGAKDYRPDYIVKQEIYQTKIAPFYDVAFAIDDKEAVCSMYKSMGIRIFNCDKI
jgi:hydroxymethylpyrimidine pyrophosphatase-like HAD family hydrolase